MSCLIQGIIAMCMLYGLVTIYLQFWKVISQEITVPNGEEHWFWTQQGTSWKSSPCTPTVRIPSVAGTYGVICFWLLTRLSCLFLWSAGKLKGISEGQVTEHDSAGHCMKYDFEMVIVPS